MKKLVLSFALLALGLAWNASAKDPAGNFSGRWTFNSEKSDPVARVTPIGRAAGFQAQTGPGVGPRAPLGRTAQSKPPVVQSPPPGNAGRIPGTTTGAGVGRGIGAGTFDGTTPVATEVPLAITHTETEFMVVNALRINGMNVPNRESYRLDRDKYEETVKGEEDAELKREIQVSVKKNRITIEIVNINKEGGKFRTTREFTLSGDGKTLTVKASSQAPHLLSSQKMVYDRM